MVRLFPLGRNNWRGPNIESNVCICWTFSAEFLETSKYRVLRSTLLFGSAISFFVAIVSIFDEGLAYHLIHGLTVLYSPFCLLSGIIATIKGRSIHGLIYCLAFGSMIIGVLLTVSTNIGLIERYEYRFGLLYGTTLENILMLVAIGQKINVLEKKNHITTIK